MDRVRLEDQGEGELYRRAAELAASGSECSYAAFLCHELLRRNPDHLEARQLLGELRKKVPRRTKLQKLRILWRAWAKVFWFSLRLRKKRKECLMALEELLDVFPNGEMVWRLMSRLALQLEYFNTAVFCIENIGHRRRKMSDVIRLGEAYLGCGHFAGAVEVASFLLEKDPENVRARDLLWQSSIEDTLGKQDGSGTPPMASGGPVRPGARSLS